MSATKYIINGGRMQGKSLSSASAVLLKRGRGYFYKKKYPQVMVYTKHRLEIDILERQFGGNHYIHRGGWVWLLSDRKGIRAMVEKMKPHLPVMEEYGFKNVVENVLGGSNEHAS
jgi:hypothetical protein